MALSPFDATESRIIETSTTPAPSKTYALGASGFIDGDEALKQAVLKIVETARGRFLIYDNDYGCELEELIGQDVTPELLRVEIPRIIKDAVMQDDRVEDATNFIITQDGDKVYIEFTVVTASGEVAINAAI